MTTTEKGQIAAELFADEETGMVWQPVESSQIAEIGYDASANILGIKFPAGKRSAASEYHYANVTPEMHREFMAAESIGTFFGKNIKNNPSYPYQKLNLEVEPVLTPNGDTVIHGRKVENPPNPSAGVVSSTQAVHEDTNGGLPSPGTALAVIDSMADDLLFTPGAVTDAQLAAGREWYLTEAKKYDISTEKARTEFKRFARPLQKLRTGIEARAKELTGATKRKIAAIDAEKRRLVGIVGGIEDEVLAPLTSWQQEEDARQVMLSHTCNELAAKGQRVYMDTADIQSAIAELEAFDVSGMQEYKLSAESAIVASLKVLKPELERRKEMEAQAAELAKLRAEAAERAEQDRQDTLAKIALQQAEQETAARKAEAEAAVEAERKRAAAQAAEEYAQMEARAADANHRQVIEREVLAALSDLCSLDGGQTLIVLGTIAQGLIPHVRIEY